MAYFKVLILCTLCINFVFGSQSNLKKDEVPAIVSAEWLNKNIRNPKLVIVDLRPYEEFKKEHIKNSVNIPAGENLFDEKKFMPGLDFLKQVFSNAGIDNNSMVVAYDDGRFIFAARFYWILETLGHNNVGILNIGYSNAQKYKLPISTIEKKPIAKNFVPRVDSTKVQTKLSTLMAIGNKTIIDGRKSSH
jgi:thiosulfate/3-mercaptopyruvate sulfurtransferase